MMDWRKLTLRQKIGQTMLMLPDRVLELKLGGGSLTTLFERYPVTGYFMGWKLYDGVADDHKVAHIRAEIETYQKASRLPLLFQEDYESGVNLPGMTPFPRAMALGAANSPELAYAYGQNLAGEARSVGVRWVLHPVADLNLNPLNPITNVRSISDDPDKAIRLLARQIAGLQENGVAATIKHFPGDGVDSRDQHLATTCNAFSREQWYRYHGRGFQELSREGVAAIMPGHITLPACQKERLNGLPPPATLSKELLTGLLKDEMGFKGVIVSDAMTMGGFRGWYPSRMEGEIQSFLAGVDVLLWPSYEYLDEVEKRIQEGRIPMERLDDAVARGARIYATLDGYACRSDATHITKPDVGGQVRTMRAALADAGLTPEAIGYCNSHGTATQVGDTVECEALQTIWGEHTPGLRVSATKSMHGHLLGATGGLETAITALALYHRQIPPTAHCQQLDENCQVQHVLGRGVEAPQLSAAISNSFAFGGSNASLVLRRYQ